jgi:hypothetical protein
VLVIMGMSGHCGAGALWACVKVTECYDPSSTDTLTRVKSLEHVCEHVLSLTARSLQ